MQPSEIAGLVHRAFAESLNREVGEDQDFFEAGGDSLAAERILTMVSQELGRQIPGWILLDNPTIQAFSKALAEP